MSSSFLNWLKACLFLTVFFVGCSDADNDWSLCRAVDQGRYSVRMPAESGSQNGTLVLGKDTIVSHIDILADSGITYASSWFEIPPQYAGLSEGAVLDSIWPLIVNRVNGTAQHDAPNPWSSDAAVRAGWFVNSDDIRLGVVLRTLGQRVVVLNAATPAPFFTAREERNMLRFLDSFEKL